MWKDLKIFIYLLQILWKVLQHQCQQYLPWLHLLRWREEILGRALKDYAQIFVFQTKLNISKVILCFPSNLLNQFPETYVKGFGSLFSAVISCYLFQTERARVVCTSVLQMKNCRSLLGPSWTCTMELFRENNWRLKAINYFCKKALSQMFDWVLNTLLDGVNFIL